MKETIEVVRSDGKGFPEYSVFIKTQAMHDLAPVINDIGDEEAKIIKEYCDRFNMSVNERMSLLFFTKDCVLRRTANIMALEFAKKYNVPSSQVILEGATIKNGKIVDKCNFPEGV